MKLGLSTDHVGLGGLSVSLRPDERHYLKDGDIYRDFDARSGSPYRKSASIKLVDSYSIHIDPIEQMSLQFGVFDHIAFDPASYPDFFNFTGKVQLPQKFSGLSIDWGNTRGIPTVTRPEPSQTFGAGFVIFQGNEDRAENYVKSDDSFDTAAESEDSHLNGALHASFRPSDSVRFMALVGGGASKAGAGKATQTFAQILSELEFRLSKTVVTFSLDLRRDQESFAIPDLKAPDLIQQSYELFSSLRFKPETWAIWGARYGTSDRHNSSYSDKLKFRFMQGEVGFLHLIHPDLSISSLMSYESHIQTDERGNTSGALQLNGREERGLKRFILSLRYNLGRAT